MAEPVFCVDLSNDSRDFRHIATEPGLAMLDRTGANYSLMNRWFGSLVAEPEYQGKERVNFFVKTEDDARVDGVEVYPATKEDLEGELNDQFKSIQSRLKKAQPESATEQTLHRVVRKTFNSLTNDLDDRDHEFYFYKYREGRGAWKLLWTWGFQRVDEEPGVSVICGNESCQQLLVKRPKEKLTCPACATVSVGRRKPPGRILGVKVNTLIKSAVALLLLLLLLYFGWPRLVVTPNKWAGPQGGKTNVTVSQKSWFFFNKDVTAEAKASTETEGVARYDAEDGVVRGIGQGETTLSFTHGGYIANARITVGKPLPPARLAVDPNRVQVAAGSRAKVRVLGHYEDDDIDPLDVTDWITWEPRDESTATAEGDEVIGRGRGKTTIKATLQIDEDKFELAEGATSKNLTGSVLADVGPPSPPDSIYTEPEFTSLARGATEKIIVWGHYDNGNDPIDFTREVSWETADASIAHCYDGVLEGGEPGATVVTASLKHSDTGELLAADIDVKTVEADFRELKLAVDPGTVGIGQRGAINVIGVDSKGKEYQLTGSSRLQLSVEPSTAATIKDAYLIGQAAGDSKLVASLPREGGEPVAGELAVTISNESFLPDSLVVEPRELEMVVYEGFPLDIISPFDEEIDIVSSNSAIVERYAGSYTLAARSPGEAIVTVRQGKVTAEVKVTVTQGEIDEIEMMPRMVNLRVGSDQYVRVIGTLVPTEDSPNGRQFDIVPDALFWEKQPRLENVRFERESLHLTGVQATYEPQEIRAYLAKEAMDGLPTVSAQGFVAVAEGGRVTEIVGLSGFDSFAVHPPIALGAGSRYLNAGQFLGDRSLVYNNGGLVVGDNLPADSILSRAGLAPGTSILGVDGYSLAGLSPQEIEDYFRTHPVVDGTRIRYITPGGDEGVYALQSELVGNAVLRLDIARGLNVTATDFNAELQISVLAEGQYRVVDAKTNEPLTDWQTIGAQSKGSFRTKKIAREPDNEYKVVIERDRGGRVQKYEATFKLQD